MAAARLTLAEQAEKNSLVYKTRAPIQQQQPGFSKKQDYWRIGLCPLYPKSGHKSWAKLCSAHQFRQLGDVRRATTTSQMMAALPSSSSDAATTSRRPSDQLSPTAQQ